MIKVAVRLRLIVDSERQVPERAAADAIGTLRLLLGQSGPAIANCHFGSPDSGGKETLDLGIAFGL